jgi:hypothetical protein
MQSKSENVSARQRNDGEAMVTATATSIQKSNVDAALQEAGAKLRAMLSAADCLRVDNRRATSALVMCEMDNCVRFSFLIVSFSSISALAASIYLTSVLPLVLLP